MTLYINGEPVNQAPSKCEYVEYASARCDVVTLLFKDSTGEIRNRELKKGDVINASNGNIDTGTMYISDIQYSGERIFLKALSMPLKCFRTQNGFWAQIGFNELIKGLAEETGLNIKFLHPLKATYINVARVDEAPIKFLSKRLMLEGYACKIYNDTIIIYDEKIQENKETFTTVDTTSFSEPPEYSTSDAGLISQVDNSYKGDKGFIKTTVKSGKEGKILRLNMAVSTIDESERFSMGMMREANRYEFVGSGHIEKAKYKSGQALWITDAPYGHDGQNFIYMTKTDLIKGSQVVYFRKPIEGAY